MLRDYFNSVYVLCFITLRKLFSLVRTTFIVQLFEINLQTTLTYFFSKKKKNIHFIYSFYHDRYFFLLLRILKTSSRIIPNIIFFPKRLNTLDGRFPEQHFTYTRSFQYSIHFDALQCG